MANAAGFAQPQPVSASIGASKRVNAFRPSGLLILGRTALAAFSSYAPRSCGNIRLIFAYTVSMFHGPTPGIRPFVVNCKGCQQNIAAPVQTLPDSWIVAECPLCGEKRRYLPADIFQGRISHDLLSKPPRIADRR